MTRWIFLPAVIFLPCIQATDLMIRRFDVEITGTTAKLTWVHDLGHHDSGTQFHTTEFCGTTLDLAKVTYEIERMSYGSPDVQTATTRLKHFEFHRLAPNQKHRFRVRAVITSNSRVPKQEGDFTQWITQDVRGGSSMEGGGSTSLPPLPLPTYAGFQFQPISNLRVLRQLGNGRSIELTWDRAQGGPQIMYSIEHVKPNGNSRLFQTNSNYRTFANLQLGRHRFRVSSSLSTAAQPDWSEVLTVDVSQSGAVGGVGVVGPAVPAPVVANLRVDRQFRNGRSIELTWEPPSGAATGVIYNVEHSPPNGRVKLTRTNMNRLVLDSLELGRHRFRVATTLQQSGQRVSDDFRSVWSQMLTVDINQGGGIGGSGVVDTPRNGHGSHVGTITSGGIPRVPSKFGAAVLSPTSLHLDWQYDGGISPPGVYYVVTMKMPSTGAVQRYQITDTRFTLSNLSPGEEYRLTVKSARSQADQSGSSRTVYQRMPTWSDVLAVDNIPVRIRVLTRTGGLNAANVTWSVPRDAVHLIKGYEILLSKDENAAPHRWQLYPSRLPEVTLQNLDPASTYYVKLNVLVMDGSRLNGTTAYRFNTRGSAPRPLLQTSQRIVINPPPVGEQQRLIGEENKPFMISCAVEGNAPETIHWYNGSSKIGDDWRKSVYAKSLNGKVLLLMFKKLQEHHAARYTCKVVDQKCQQIERNVLLVVVDSNSHRLRLVPRPHLEAAERILIRPAPVGEQNRLVAYHHSHPFAISCGVEGKAPECIHWYKGSSKIGHDKRKRVYAAPLNGKAMLVFKRVQEHDAATYTCKVVNLKGQQTETDVQLVVIQKILSSGPCVFVQQGNGV